MISSKKSKAIGLFSGGLDSILAVKLMTEQGVEAIALHFRVPFAAPGRPAESDRLQSLAEVAGASLVSVDVGDDYFDLVRKPQYGYSRALAPCIDCIGYMLRKARELAMQLKADFVFTGEVVGQRAHCQNKRSLKLLETVNKMNGRLLRPLSAKLLEPTIPELTGLVRRERLLDLKGHGRRRQIRLAAEYGILDYAPPAGGCLLTDKNFAARARDAITAEQFTAADVALLTYGRHFRLESGAKVVVGRNEAENSLIESLVVGGDELCRPVGVVGPVALLRSRKKTKKEIETTARLCVRYSDAPAGHSVKVSCGGSEFKVKAAADDDIRQWLVKADQSKAEPEPAAAEEDE
jgi:tRNA-uridine 2-sulfurtransferase